MLPTIPVFMPLCVSAATLVTDRTPPNGSTSLVSGSTIAVLSAPSRATSFVATGLAASPVTACTSTRTRPVAAMVPWVMVYGT